MKIEFIKKIILACLLILNTASFLKSGTSYVFTYDDNGNRTAVSYINNCRTVQQTDTLIGDSVLVKEMSVLSLLNTAKAYPNPMQDFFIVHIPNEVINPITIMVYDFYGKLVLVEENILTNSTIIKTCTFSTGTFLVKVSDNKGNVLLTTKLVKI